MNTQLTGLEYDKDELVRRAGMHPVAGPVLELIARDLIIERLQQRLAEHEPADDTTEAPAS